MIHTPETSAKILDAIQSIELSNNGWSWVDNDDDTLIEALRHAGYVVFEVRGGVKAYTRAAQEALAAEYKARGAASFAVLRDKPSTPREHAPDYEGMILARQERWMMDA